MESLKERLLFLANLIDTRMATARSADDSARPSFEIDMPTRELTACSAALREASEALGVSPPAVIDNGNPYIFCDYVDSELHGCACIRGAGHDGPHALSLPPYPLGPVILQASSGVSPSGGWQPIESAPKDRELLLYGPRESGAFGIVQGAWNRGGAMHMPHWMGGIFHPTHWMPLPAPPASPSLPDTGSGEPERSER